MSLKKFDITGWYGRKYCLTADELLARILEDSKSDYNWIAPANELVKVCKEPNFPNDYATIIKSKILNCFANFEHRANNGDDRYLIYGETAEAVQFCYDSLFGIESESAVEARKNYLIEKLYSAIEFRIVDPLYHPGPTFKALREKYVLEKFAECIDQPQLDFDTVGKELRDSFTEAIKVAEAEGQFDEDEAKHNEEMAKLFRAVMDFD